MGKKLTTDEYIKIFNESYPTLELLSEYNGNKNYITVRCKIHDYVFNTKPNWLKKGSGCVKCYNDRRSNSQRLTKEQFIERAINIHGDKYDYSKVEYINNKIPIKIICKIHGEFEQRPDKHLMGQGCSKCSIIEQGLLKRLTLEEFINRSKLIHGDKYDYSKSEYSGYDNKLIIICPIHGEFEQIAGSHMNGQGCPLCQESHLERKTAILLKENNIEFERQKKFKWLGKQSLDFYLPKYNIGIECQGKQHFIEKERFGGKDGLNKIKERDIKKHKKCKENNIKLIYVIDYDIDNFNCKIYENNNI
ncbi:MAG: hypothetical protein IKT40_00350, partial [Bacilli bacterium]|nr:hypothetical protein [Bacilli bacterium]